MFGAGDGAMVLFGINHARSLHEAGVTKRDIQQRLWEFGRFPAGNFARSFVEAEREAGRADEHTVWRTNRPEEIYIVVAGGQGPQDVYIGAGMPQTRLVRGM